jgi:putative SOS response-associated peptidase YedK
VSHEFHMRRPRAAIDAQAAALGIALAWRDEDIGRELNAPIQPTERIDVLRAVDPAEPGRGLEGLALRWWLVPAFHTGPLRAWRTLSAVAAFDTLETSPVFRAAYGARRALVPLTCYVEYEAPAGWQRGKPKTRREMGWPGGEVRYLAALWERSIPADRPDGLESVAIVGGPGDGAPPVLSLAQGLAWLALDGGGKAALAGADDLIPQEVPREVTLPPEMRRALP